MNNVGYIIDEPFLFDLGNLFYFVDPNDPADQVSSEGSKIRFLTALQHAFLEMPSTPEKMQELKDQAAEYGIPWFSLVHLKRKATPLIRKCEIEDFKINGTKKYFKIESLASDDMPVELLKGFYDYLMPHIGLLFHYSFIPKRAAPEDMKGEPNRVWMLQPDPTRRHDELILYYKRDGEIYISQPEGIQSKEKDDIERKKYIDVMLLCFFKYGPIANMEKFGHMITQIPDDLYRIPPSVVRSPIVLAPRYFLLKLIVPTGFESYYSHREVIARAKEYFEVMLGN